MEEVISRELEYNVSDDELIQQVNKAIEESKDFKQKIDEIGKRNKLYWEKGTEKDLTRLHKKKSKVVVNRIFVDVETAIPILTSNAPEANVLGVPNDVREKIQEGLSIAYEVKYKFQQILQKLLRHWFLYRIGVLKYSWTEDGFTTINVLPIRIGIDKRATSKDDCEYIWHEFEESAEDLIAKFPKKKKDILDYIQGEEKIKSKVKYIEFWGGKGSWVCWIFNNKLLDKMKNPNFNYEGENIFKTPQFPFIFLNVFTIGDCDSLYDSTSLIEQAIPQQEGVNQLEQQIIDLNEGQKRVWTASGDVISAKKAQELVDKTGDLMVYLDRGGDPGKLGQVQSGKPDNSLFDNLTHLLSEIDNTIGMHSTTRGERAQQETLGGRQLLMGADLGRLDLIIRNIEQVVEEWETAYLQMIKTYSIEGERLIDEENNETIITAEDIPSGVIVMIKKGSTLPTDDATRMKNAIELSARDMIDPATLFEEMGYGDVPKRVQDLYQWLTITGKVQMPQAPVVEQPQQTPTEGQPNQDQSQQLDKVNQIVNSEQFQSLSDEEKLQFIQQAKQIVGNV